MAEALPSVENAFRQPGWFALMHRMGVGTRLGIDPQTRKSDMGRNAFRIVGAEYRGMQRGRTAWDRYDSTAPADGVN